MAATLHVRCPICGKTIDSVIGTETWGESIPGDTGCGNVTLHGTAMTEHVTSEHTADEHLRAIARYREYQAKALDDMRQRWPHIFADA